MNRIDYEADLRLEGLNLLDYIAFTDNAVDYYCGECAVAFFATKYSDSLEWLVDHGYVDTIHEDTVSFEQYRGQIIPLEGITCKSCHADLYPAFEEYE